MTIQKNPSTVFTEEQIGYKQTLSRRHVQMIAIGGAIGSGLFLGSAKLLYTTGPAIIISYLIAGLLALALMLALGELVLYRAASSAFVSYTREFFGEKSAYAVGWMYWFQWSITGVADLSAVGSYLAPVFSDQTWPGALLGFLLVISINLTSAHAFAEFEFWASLLKVLAIVVFLISAIFLVIFGVKIGNHHAGLANLHAGAGFWPHGSGHNWFLPILMLNAVMFSYIAIELVAVAAGEMEDAEREIPHAVKSVIGRIAIFYIGSIFLFICLQPTKEYSPGTSPFVTIATKLNNHFLSEYIPPTLTAVLIIAALSSLNSGLYSTGRILRSLALRKQAPQYVMSLTKNGVPARGICFTAIILIIGILLNYFMQGSSKDNPVFDIAVEIGALAIILVWISIFGCQLRYRQLVNHGILSASKFTAPGYPIVSSLGIILLISISIFCWWSGTPTGYYLGTSHNFTTAQLAILVFPILVIILIIGWFCARREITHITQGKLGPTWKIPKS